jgi:hypothetical protein
MVRGTVLTCQRQASSLDHTPRFVPYQGHGSQLLVPYRLLPQPGTLQNFVTSTRRLEEQQMQQHISRF